MLSEADFILYIRSFGKHKLQQATFTKMENKRHNTKY